MVAVVPLLSARFTRADRNVRAHPATLGFCACIVAFPSWMSRTPLYVVGLVCGKDRSIAASPTQIVSAYDAMLGPRANDVWAIPIRALFHMPQYVVSVAYCQVPRTPQRTAPTRGQDVRGALGTRPERLGRVD